MKHSKVTILVVCVCVLSSLVTVPTMSAQTSQSIEQLGIQLYDGQISLYNVSDTGQFTFLNTLEGFNLTRLSYRTDAEWEIVLPSDIVLSPDGRHIAFTAVSSNNEPALFLYDIGQAGLLRIDSPGIGTLMWSPDSDAMLLVPHHIFTSGLLPIVEDGYLYTLASRSFAPILDLPKGYPGNFMWLPGGEYVYEVTVEVWSTTRYSNLYVADTVGQQRMLANLETLLPETQVPLTTWCSADSFYWAPVEQRLYYAASCSNDPWSNSALYSVDLQGNNRLEIDLTARYPEDLVTKTESLYVDPTTSNVFVLVNAFKDEMLDGQLQGLAHWRVLSNRNGQWEELIDTISPPDIATMGISPDGYHIAVGGLGPLTGFLSIADLVSGEVSERENDRAVCSIQWMSADILQYTELTDCSMGYNTPGQTWKLNTVTGEATQITGGLEGVVWLMPTPQTLPTNISPEANAGPDVTTTASSNGQTLVTLDGSGSSDSDGTITAYRWYENDALIAEGIIPQVELAVGEHIISLTIVDDDGAIGSDEVVITVEAASGCVPVAPTTPPTYTVAAGDMPDSARPSMRPTPTPAP